MPVAGRDRALPGRRHLERVLEKISLLADHLRGGFPSPCSRNLEYQAVGNIEWTSGFWAGLLWLAYRYSGDEAFRAAAEALMPSFRTRLDEGVRIDTHDLGFLYTLSACAAYELTRDEGARQLALRAARALSSRFLEGGRVIQAWGPLDDPEERGRVIIDSAMNTALLFWASERGGERSHGEIAREHLHQLARHLVRADGSTHHTFYVDPATGRGLYGRTHQGFSDDSCWSRGQAWAGYGFSVGYRHARDDRFRAVAKKVFDRFLDRLPADGICFWDLIFEEEDGQEKDTSAAAIAAAGMLALSDGLAPGDPDRDRYRRAAREMLERLSADHLSSATTGDGLLLHGVYNRPLGHGVNEYCVWGDYFYAEALLRLDGVAIPWW